MNQINYWIDVINDDLGTFTDVEAVRSLMHRIDENKELRWFSIKGTGVFAYMIAPNFLGGHDLAEIVFYILPEHRGSYRLVLQYLQKAEELAKDNGCTTIKIGGNIGYKDQSFLNILKRLGYVDDTVSKIIRRD